MNPIETLCRTLRNRFPDFVFDLKPPKKRGDLWDLEARTAGYLLCIAWNAQRGFGLASRRTNDPDEVYMNPQEAQTRALTLLQSREETTHKRTRIVDR